MPLSNFIDKIFKTHAQHRASFSVDDVLFVVCTFIFPFGGCISFSS